MTTEERITVAADTFTAAIAAAPYFADIPVSDERKGDINATIANAVAKLGVCVTVVAADGDGLVRVGRNLRLRIRLVAQITELYLINQGPTGTHKPALSVATAAMKAVDRQPNGLDPAGASHRDGLNEFLLAEAQPFRLVPDPRLIVYHVTAYTSVEL